MPRVRSTGAKWVRHVKPSSDSFCEAIEKNLREWRTAPKHKKGFQTFMGEAARACRRKDYDSAVFHLVNAGMFIPSGD